MGFVSALISLTFGWFALGWLQEQDRGAVVVFMLLLIIWASDTGAYFAGKQFGRHKLAPVISPNKTWEGVYGGVALALLAAWLWSGPAMQMGLTLPSVAVIAIVTAATSIGGDLFISLHKRTVKLADAGSLFPGHGGVLDRYDSLLAGAPFFALAYGLLSG
jgi:phosphatidate cytidylyltransferase